jgi:asparagine synthase (glutamine-hydrolysing)
MCGIVGYAGVAGALKLDLLSSMRDTIAHRGPDASGLWSTPDGSVVFGHRRLAILDLSAAGAQPMENSSRTSAVVYNGEIYNHEELRRELAAGGARFTGHSDTEVLLAAYDKWGEDCLDRLRGMFAFAIYDKKRNSLFMARDRAGEKPLYWAEHRGGIVFASELKALMADSEFPRRLSAEGLGYYLTFGYVPGDRCILEGVHKLMPAHSMSWSLTAGRATVRRYWDIPAAEANADATVEGLTDELQGLLTSAVREQLVADVPLAVLLSGGVDSSVITAIAARVSSSPVRTFTVTLPKHPRLDERRYARSVSEYLGTDHEELPLDESSVDLIEALAAQYDEPIADSSMIPTYLLARSVSRHCKVVLGGDGGDELFGGYLAYQTALRRERHQRKLPHWTRSFVASVARRTMQVGQRGRNALMALDGDVADGIAQSAVWTDYGDLASLSSWLAPRLSEATPKAWRRSLVNSERGLPGAAMATDFRSYLPDDILVKVDRASMLCSLEVRAPFLDQRVVEFAYRSVPNHLRVSLNERKILLKKLAKRLLPQNLDLDRKQGFTIPISEWIGPNVVDGWREQCRDQIRSILSGPAAGALLSRRNDQAADHFLYAIILLTSWMRHYRISV